MVQGTQPQHGVQLGWIKRNNLVLQTKIKAHTFHKTCKSVQWKRKTNQSQNRKHKITAYFLVLPDHCARMVAVYRSSKSKGNHANPTNTFHFQIEVLVGIKQQKTLHNSIQLHTTQNWKGTGIYIYTDCYSILTYPALWCNLDVLMEKISTLFNYVLSLPMLLQFTNMLTHMGCW